MTAAKRNDKIKTGMYGGKPYACPLYKYPIRQARFFIATISMASKAAVELKARRESEQWILRGVALLATIDFE